MNKEVANPLLCFLFLVNRVTKSGKGSDNFKRGWKKVILTFTEFLFILQTFNDADKWNLNDLVNPEAAVLKAFRCGLPHQGVKA